MVNKFRAEVDASEFGEGFTIRLDMEGWAQLESDMGDGVPLGRLMTLLPYLSAKSIKALLVVALRNRDGVLAGDTAMPDVPLATVGAKCQDAVALFIWGKTAEEWRKDEEAKAKKAAEANPTTGTAA